ncbi:MAG: 30S ribosomal protein S20 [Gammaproteobacteria bacterium CG11_big_fil_rev_8_21_14_0_20_46_22]|nr:MAG: 30S ribosomal protein S20 [Gammaproteobacteria bacterium CG12_big_fil_rev_8_21_14_0_65_46_12]PIR10855.1 MAG: 30S ribosomal protein S20 [Gammaproteobacteria bacterium CG11_big_fil_rev_8_21_14_0_20_46_22]
MANTPQSRKRARQALKRRMHNVSLRSKLRTFIKRVRYAVEAGKKDEAMTAFNAAVPVIDGMASKGLIHKNAAARYKSRLNSQIKALSI